MRVKLTPLRIITGVAGIALVVAIILAALKFLRGLEEAAANAGVSEGSTAVR